MGVGGEDTITILGRNGAIPFVISEDIIIPADKTPVELKIASSAKNKDGSWKNAAPLKQGNKNVSAFIDNIKGNLYIEKEDSTSSQYIYYFAREIEGKETKLKAGTEIILDSCKQNLNYIPIVFIGQNGGYEDIQDLIKQQKLIIEHQKGSPMDDNGGIRFIIIGLHTGTAENRLELEAAMEAEYGKQYINLREYMSTNALNDAKLEMTEKDKEMISKGLIPASLMTDGVHFNSIGYELIGNLIYKRMDELGYFDEVKKAMTELNQIMGYYTIGFQKILNTE